MLEDLWRWALCYPQLVAAAIAFFAFVVALQQFGLSRKHNVRSVRPLLFHKEQRQMTPIKRSTNGSIVATDLAVIHEYSVSLHNAGLGPAMIESCVFASTNGTFSPFSDSNIHQAIKRSFPDPSVRPEISWTTLGSGTVIGKEEVYELLKVKASNFQQLAALDAVFKAVDFQLVIEFTTLHDERFVYDTRSTPVRQKKRGWWSRRFGSDASVA